MQQKPHIWELLGKTLSLARRFFTKIVATKDRMLKENTNSNSNLSFSEEKAAKYWNLALDYKNGKKKEWNKLKSLAKEQILSCTEEELDRKFVYFAKLAYQE